MKVLNILILVSLAVAAGAVKSAASELKQNHPNPFSSQTSITFVLDDQQNVCLNIYDLRGNKVRGLCNRTFTADTHDVVWDGKDASGSRVPDGIYFFRLETESMKETKKMLLMR